VWNTLDNGIQVCKSQELCSNMWWKSFYRTFCIFFKGILLLIKSLGFHKKTWLLRSP